MKRIFIWALLLAAGWASAADPTNVSGCALWFKADAGVYTNSSGKVTNWVDQAHGIQAGNTNAAPTVPVVTANWTNGMPALYWSTASYEGLTISNGSLAITNGQSRTFFLVLAAGVGEVFGPSTGYRISIDSDGRVGLRNIANYYYVNAQLQSGIPYILTVVAQAGSPTNVSVYRNGELVGSTNNFDCAFYALTNAVGVGWAHWTVYPDRNFNGGRIAEVVLFDRALGSNDQASVGRYLSLKYAIPSVYVPAAPAVVTVPGSVVRRNTSAVLAGKPGATADVRFFWSTNGALGEAEAGWDGVILVTNVAANVQANVLATNLLPATTYYWRCSASNANGVSWAPVTNSFKTHGTPLSAGLPPVMGGLVLNLDASSLVYTNNEKFEWWPDLSATATDFTTNFAAGWPTYIASVAALSNKPAVRFTASTQLGGGAIPTIGAGTNRTAFLVVIPKTGSGSDLFGSDTAYRIGLDALASRCEIRNAAVAATARIYSSTNSLSWDLPHVVAITDMGGDPATRIYVDGTESTPYQFSVAVSTDRLFGWSMATNMAVGGANYATREYQGDVAQILLYNRVLSVGEQQAVGYFLQTKYSLTGAYSAPRGTMIMVR